MTMRDKLIEILQQPIYTHELVDPSEAVADYLIDSRVVVLPCNPGERLFHIVREYEDGAFRYKIYSLKDDHITVETDGWFKYDGCEIRHADFGDTLFRVYEEAELVAAQKERGNNG